MIIDGKKIAKEIIEELKKLPKPEKKLAAILVGEDPASVSFLKQKNKVAAELGLVFEQKQFDQNIQESELIEEIKKIGTDVSVGGVVLQLPLPEKFNREKVISSLESKKDVDNLTGKAPVLPPAVEAMRTVLSTANFSLQGKSVAIVGQGFLVGAPIAKWLKEQNVDYEVFGRNNELDLKKYDLVITGVGKAGLVKSDSLKNGAGVIDFGFDMKNGKISGDLDVQSSKSLAFYTPTPGGTGPVLVAALFKNFYGVIANNANFYL